MPIYSPISSQRVKTRFISPILGMIGSEYRHSIALCQFDPIADFIELHFRVPIITSLVGLRLGLSGMKRYSERSKCVPQLDKRPCWRKDKDTDFQDFNIPDYLYSI
jgi:hypothetical protein